ncbi:MAG: hypothetical protein O8C58_04745 [Candidatus Methanoperedens sp.]|nr:hypothetical protein [Candidatus Methanoperedens sp.]
MYSLVDIAPTIAGILHISMPRRDGAVIPEVIKELDKCGKLILIIVDGFGLSIYERYKYYFNFRGMIFKCRGVSMHTTPSIATILTGLHPENHRVFETKDTYNSEGLSIVELASMQGIISSVIMEKMGARSFQGSVDMVVEIEEQDAVQYDYIVRNALMSQMQKAAFTVAHFRILDRFYHSNGNTEMAVEILSTHLKDIAACSKNAGIIICGDHPPHNEENNDVPLIALSTLAKPQ